MRVNRERFQWLGSQCETDLQGRFFFETGVSSISAKGLRHSVFVVESFWGGKAKSVVTSSFAEEVREICLMLGVSKYTTER